MSETKTRNDGTGNVTADKYKSQIESLTNSGRMFLAVTFDIRGRTVMSKRGLVNEICYWLNAMNDAQELINDAREA